MKYDDMLLDGDSCSVCGAMLRANNDTGICDQCLADIDSHYGGFNNIDMALERKRKRTGREGHSK